MGEMEEQTKKKLNVTVKLFVLKRQTFVPKKTKR